MNLSVFFDTDDFAAQARLIARYNDALNEAVGEVLRLRAEGDVLRKENDSLRVEVDALKLELKGLIAPKEG